MRKTDSKDVAAKRRKAGVVTPPAFAGGARRPRVTPMHVVECDAWELPTFASDESLIPALNRGVWESVRRQTNGHGDSSWRGGIKSLDDAADLLRKGWPEGAERARKLADGLLPLLPPPESLRRKTRWSDDGGELDRDRLYSSGIETAFRSTRQVLQRSPRTIKLVGSWSINGSYSAEQVAWNGAALTALVDLLESADFRVELSLCLAAEQYTPETVSMPIVRIKTANEPLNINTVAAVAGHAGIFRSYGFMAICSSPYKVSSSYGHALMIEQAWKQAVDAGVLETADGFMELAVNEHGAIGMIAKVLKKLMPENVEFAGALDGLLDSKRQTRGW